MEPTNYPLRSVNNAIYSELGERWYEADDDPVALLRAESRLHNPWVSAEIARALGSGSKRVLDLGCGGGFLTNHLAASGHRVTGLDAADSALAIARERDATGAVTYEHGDATHLAHPDASFDVVCAMDFLEHVTDPARVVAEAARVLSPGGLFLFHTFNRNVLAWLVVIKGVEWFVKNTPKDMHVLHLFIKPAELAAMCGRNGLDAVTFRGSRPCFDRALWRMLRTGVVPRDVTFRFTSSTALAYLGSARRETS